MEVELEFTMKINGDIVAGNPTPYKITDGKDADFCDLCQEARKKLSHKMLELINAECK